MVRRILTLYVEDSLITEAKARNINLSKFFETALETELGYLDAKENKTKDEIIQELKGKINKLTETIKKLTEENAQLRKRINELKGENRVIVA